MTAPFRGNLFSSDFLSDSITRLSDWRAIDDNALSAFRTELQAHFAAFPTSQTPNETQTEDDLIWKVLSTLGWSEFLRQQNLAPEGREDAPDGLLFLDKAAKLQANKTATEWRRYELGAAVVESKRWQRPLDRQSGRKGEEIAPFTQILRYLGRIDDLTNGELRWGILTNGAQWRLYYQGARPPLEDFCEIDLAVVLGIPDHDGGLFALTEEQKAHWLKVFALVFRIGAFVPGPTDKRTFHQRALDEAQHYEKRVSTSLSQLVFGRVFPDLIRAIAASVPDALLHEVREAALVVLYRLLFILYAEDRDLLPVNERRYKEYALRDKVRRDIGDRKDRNETFSNAQTRYWSILMDLCVAIDEGDGSIGLPPYNGGLFDADRVPLLKQVRISDKVMADVIDALSFESGDTGRKYINYRDLSVQQLGSIYERLLEQEVVRQNDDITIRPNPFARRGSGSYYTPDELVKLIVVETVGPLVQQHMDAFHAKAEELAKSRKPEAERLRELRLLDPAERILELKVCDPAMGSGHFLVTLVDYLAIQVTTAMADAEAAVSWAHYVSPLIDRIEDIRSRIYGNAQSNNWTIDVAHLDDRHIIHRVVLKHCIYGVDKNEMAVELAKVALWLRTFTVGAPLSFLDHHLRCGDSLFGSWINPAIAKADKWGKPLLLHEPMKRALGAAAAMQTIEDLTDAEVAEAHRSADISNGVKEMIEPLNALLALIHALDWLDLKDKDDKIAVQSFFDGVFGDPVSVALGKADLSNGRRETERFRRIFDDAQRLIREENFLNWQVAFPGVWSQWESADLKGGFDAVIGNPPWDRMRLEDVEWFEARLPAIAQAHKADDRKKMIAGLEKSKKPLFEDYQRAVRRAENAMRMARKDGQFPMLSKGEINVYALFVERATRLVKPTGIIGLLTPTGIASDKSSAAFFKGVATNGRLISFLDFENKGTDRPPYFPDVHAQFKFAAFISAASPQKGPAKCGFFLNTPADILIGDRCFPLTAEDFARVNPNTGTIPLFRSRRDATLTTAIYKRLPVLVNKSTGQDVKTWPVKYARILDMTLDSKLFKTRSELEEKEKAYPLKHNRFRNKDGDWLPLYEGKMIWHFDHRAASITVNPENTYRPAVPDPATLEQHQDPDFTPTPEFWVKAADKGYRDTFALGFRDVTNPTDRRTLEAAFIPHHYAGNTLPLLLHDPKAVERISLLCANLNAIILDYVARQKVQKNHLNLYIVEQLPVVPPGVYDETKFGRITARKVVSDAVLELTYTSHDMAHYAVAMGHTNNKGEPKPPFKWDEQRRAHLTAKLNAVYFHLYGVTKRDDVSYVFSTFDVLEEDETKTHRRYLSRDLCLAWMNALANDDPNAAIAL